MDDEIIWLDGKGLAFFKTIVEQWASGFGKHLYTLDNHCLTVHERYLSHSSAFVFDVLRSLNNNKPVQLVSFCRLDPGNRKALLAAIDNWCKA